MTRNVASINININMNEAENAGNLFEYGSCRKDRSTCRPNYNAYGVGDAWTNLFNPFWAIALLAITQVKARDMFVYSIAILIMAIVPLMGPLSRAWTQ